LVCIFMLAFCPHETLELSSGSPTHCRREDDEPRPVVLDKPSHGSG
jgi:hypothetical protein